MATFWHLFVVLVHVAGNVVASHLPRTDLTHSYSLGNGTLDTSTAGYDADSQAFSPLSSSNSWSSADEPRIERSGDESQGNARTSTQMLTFNSIDTFFTTSTSSAARSNLFARQDEPSEISTCSPLSTAKSVIATCTPVAGKANGQICRRRLTATVSGCDVVDATSTTTIASTITAYCDSNGGCGGAACQKKRERTAHVADQVIASAMIGGPNPGLQREDSGKDLSDLVQVKAPESPEDPDIPGPLAEVNDYDTYDKFMVEEMGKAEHLNQVPHRMDDPTGSSSSIVRAWKKKAINVGVRDLYGCTCVIAVSRRGVWMSHLFEVPTFSHPQTYAEPDEDVWMKEAEQGIFTGDESGKFIGLNAFTAGEPDLSLFDSMKYGQTTNRASIFIVTPIHRDEEVGIPTSSEGFWDCKYSVEIERLHKALAATYKEVTVATYDDRHGGYDTPDRDATMKTTGKGRVFVQYTPRSNEIPEKSDAGSAESAPKCEAQKAMIRLWTYGNPPAIGVGPKALFEDEWDAMPDQVIKPLEEKKNTLNARDDAEEYKDSCVWFGDETSSSTSQTQPTSTTALHTSTPSTTTPAVFTPIGGLACEVTSATAASSSIVTYCTCNDYQVHGAYTTSGTEGGATIMCNPKDPQGEPITATFTTTAHVPYHTGICRMEQHERTNGTIEELSRPNDAYIAILPPITTTVQMFDSAGLLMTDNMLLDYHSPYYWHIAPNRGMGFPYSIKIWPSINKGFHSVFLEHLWNYEQTYEESGEMKYSWTTEDTVEQPPRTYPRCLSGEWTEKDGKSDRFVQCWYFC